MDDLTRERYGAVSPAEARRRPTPLLRLEGDGRPDTPEAIAQRRLDLNAALAGWWLRNRKAAA